MWLDASLPVLDKYVNERVDCMIDNGLLLEVSNIYKPNADFTRGLRQAIGVREFEELFRECFRHKGASDFPSLTGDDRHNPETGITKADGASRPSIPETLCSNDGKLKSLLDEAIDKLKANTRKLVRRQVINSQLFSQ